MVSPANYPMDLRLKDKVIIVTGGASGIGAAVCRLLAEESAIPVVIDQNPADFFTVLADLCDPVACEQAVNRIIDRYGRIDGLINNVGTNDGVSLEHGSYEAFVHSLQRNVLHYKVLTQLSTPELQKHQGAIVNIISKVAFTGQGGTQGYAAANGVRAGLTQEPPQGVRVNGVVVAECDTPAYAKWIAGDREKLDKISSHIPLGNRLTLPEEVAQIVVFLLSPIFGTNGSLIFVDGGYVHLDRQLEGTS